MLCRTIKINNFTFAKTSVDKLYINNNINKPIKKIVCSGCWEIKSNIDIHCENESCLFNKNKTIKESGLEVIYLDATQQLDSIIKREKLTILNYKTVKKISKIH